MRIVLSSGHGRYVAGASGKKCGPWGLDEVTEARHLVEAIADHLLDAEVEVETFHENEAHDVDTNLDNIVKAHNTILQPHDYDISVHFNAFECGSGVRGCEVWYKTSSSDDDFPPASELARSISRAMAEAMGLPDRGPKQTDDLRVLNSTNEKCVLLEVCFVDMQGDCLAYKDRFHEAAGAIAAAIAEAGEDIEEPDRPERPVPPPGPVEGALFYARGTCSWFGGPEDDGVSPSEGLAFIYPDDFEQFRHLFLPEQPPNTTGMARRLDSDRVMFVACRWDYDRTPKEMLRDHTKKVLARANGRAFYAYPADWGPHEQQTGRAADLSRCLMAALGCTTDDEVEIIYPAPEDE